MSTPGSNRSNLNQILQNAQQALNQAGQGLGPAVQGLAPAVQNVSKVLLPVIRRVMPTLIAQQIIGVTLMTGPTGSIFALRARYHDWQYSGCECIERLSFDFDYIIDLPLDHQSLKEPDEIRNWAILHCQRPFNYGRFAAYSDRETQSPVNFFRFSFAHPDDAFEFKLRWV